MLLQPDHELLRNPLATYEFTQEERTSLFQDLTKSCKELRGLGLSANQVGINRRVFVVVAGEFEEAFFNPEITSTSEETNMLDEGCLSYPGIFVNLKRPKTITIKYQNVEGDIVENTFSGITARIVQHEYDHMEGKNFLDHASPLKKGLAYKKARKAGYRY